MTLLKNEISNRLHTCVHPDISQATKKDGLSTRFKDLFLRLCVHIDKHEPGAVSLAVVGCPDIKAPPGAEVKRDGDHLTVICGPVTRSLTCSGSKWIGDVGNCTAGELLQKRKNVTRFQWLLFSWACQFCRETRKS